MTQLMLGITLTLVACGPAASGGVKPEQTAAEGALSQHGTGISSGLMYWGATLPMRNVPTRSSA